MTSYMRLRAALVCLSLALIVPSVAQVGSGTGAPNPHLGSQHPTVVKAVNSFSGGKALVEVELTGTVKTHYGTDDQGTATLSVNANGSSTVEYRLGSGTSKNAASINDSAKSCSWSGSDGVNHKTPLHNCARGVAWFLPAFSMQVAASSEKDSFESISTNGQSSPNEGVKHSRIFNRGKTETELQLQKLSETEIEVDPQSGLVASIQYNIHPDKTSTVNIPVEVRYSDYREVNGIKVPFKVQKFVNNTLVEDLTIEHVNVN